MWEGELTLHKEKERKRKGGNEEHNINFIDEREIEKGKKLGDQC